MTEYISGVDAIMHVASALPNTGEPQVILEVRGAQSRVQDVVVSNVQKNKPFRPLSPALPAYSMPLLLKA